MAEFKTAEQYVVEKVESLERELEETKKAHAGAIDSMSKELARTRQELSDAYDLLNMFRDFIQVRQNNYFRNTVSVDNIYEKEHPEIVARIMEYYDLRPEDESDE